MADTSLKEKEDALNPGEVDYRRKVSSNSAYATHGLDQLEAYANDPANKTDVSVADSENDPTWEDNTAQEDGRQQSGRVAQAVGVLKKRKGLLGLIGVFGVTGGLLASFFGPASMIVSLMENLTSNNDSASTSLERRFMKAFGYASTGDPICAKTSKNIKCRMGKISNKALTKLQNKGVVGVTDGTQHDGKRTGYPAKNPTHYDILDNDGKTLHRIESGKLMSFLAQPENRRLASKVLGVRGAFNLRVTAWTGKYLSNKLYKKFAISRTGGLADGKHESSEGKNRYASSMEKLRAKIPPLGQLDGIKDGLGSRVTKDTKKAGKGGIPYTLAVAGCIAVKAPGYIAAGVAAAQLAQIMPIAMDTVLSPGSKAKAMGAGSNFSGDDMAAVGATLTNQTKRKSDGKLTSALDSKYLLAAMGVNKSAPPVSKEFTPGYGVLKNGFIQGSNKAANATDAQCNVILSPAAMYTAMAAQATANVVQAGTGVGLITAGINIAASLILSEVAAVVLKEVVQAVGDDVIKAIAENKAIPQAEGEELGDIIGIGATSFFAVGGMSRNLPTLTQSQLVGFNELKRESENFQREMDIASLSPLDISSKHTFMGSIVHNLRLGMVSNGAYNNTFSSILSNIFSLPATALYNPVGAADSFSSEYCGYADEFEMSSGNPETDPAINMAGLPCTGITQSQANMSTEEAIKLIEEQGWLDESEPISDGATIDDLVLSGYIKADTPLSDYIESCGNPISGDYIFNSGGCVMDDATPQKKITDLCVDGLTDLEGNKKTVCNEPIIEVSGETSVNLVSSQTPSQRALIAIPVFLLDYQLIQAVNGEDDEEAVSQTVSASSKIDYAALYTDSTSVMCDSRTTDAGVETGYRKGSPVQVRLCIPEGLNHKINSRISAPFMDMLEAIKAEGLTLGTTSGFRDNETQKILWNRYKNGTGNPAANPGYSNHQMGLAIDLELRDSSGTKISNNIGNCKKVSGVCQPKFNSPSYNWLLANASKYGFSQYEEEFWHWEVEAP